MKFPPILKRFPHFLHGGDYNPDQWLDRPEVIDDDFRLMPLAGCNTFSVGIFSWSSYEVEEGVFTFGWLDAIMNRLAAKGYNALLATPSAARPAWMAKKYPEVRRVDSNGRREPYHSRHNQCWSSPVYREKVGLINRKLAERYRGHPALAAWHVSNEYTPGCFCDLCLASFHGWLAQRYQTLDQLNAAWWTGFWSHRYTAWDEIDPRDSCVDGLALDWKRFQTWHGCDFMRHEIAPLRELTPEVPVTTNMMELNEFAFDYWRVAEICDFSGYKLLVAPMLFMLKPGVAERLKQFVANGGTLVCTYLTGCVNETNLCFTGGWPGDGLRNLFGLWNEELDGFTPQDRQSLVMISDNSLGLQGEFVAVEFAERIHLEGATALATYGHDFYAGEPAVTVNRFDNGRAYYLAARTGDDFLAAFYGRLVADAELATCLPSGNPAGVHGHLRTDGRRRFLFLYNCNRDAVTVNLGALPGRNLLEGGERVGSLTLPGYGSTVLEQDVGGR